MFSVTVHVTGLQATQERLTRIRTTLTDFTEILTSLSSTLLRFYEDSVFGSRGEVIGAPWAPLKEKTALYKNRHWPGRDILIRRGDLQHGFDSDITPKSLFITNRDPKFLFHQLGTSGGPGRGHNIPARKMLAVTGPVEGIIREEVETGIRAKIDATGI